MGLGKEAGGLKLPRRRMLRIESLFTTNSNSTPRSTQRSKSSAKMVSFEMNDRKSGCFEQEAWFSVVTKR
ncbi:hypothetical protein RchiOBHm_Chr7g0203881 [Rosa chinensis]|uniref:Uncharacterized protein n=1 Tax=Rosa chinensis TaxID=74649 RepID=A0A2P6P8J7_ROSCH|nr:hypothetical protein RchiOBHm_Chr7g0203881 [Rosa chinensis]